MRSVAVVAVVVVLSGETEVMSWPLATPRVDLDVVDRLARLQQRVRRAGCRVSLRAVDPTLRELLRLAGLDELLREVSR
ncbi:MAG TPA: hypothetical protein VM345_04615 [Acidimicrobiales bacterium]|nr:hypothetical protein [Acidimicrobiales bacterium]